MPQIESNEEKARAKAAEDWRQLARVERERRRAAEQRVKELEAEKQDGPWLTEWAELEGELSRAEQARDGFSDDYHALRAGVEAEVKRAKDFADRDQGPPAVAALAQAHADRLSALLQAPSGDDSAKTSAIPDAEPDAREKTISPSGDEEPKECVMCGDEREIDDLAHLPGKTWICPACEERDEAEADNERLLTAIREHEATSFHHTAPSIALYEAAKRVEES